MNNDGIAFGDGLESMREVDTVILRFSVYMLSFPLSGEPIRKENPSGASHQLPFQGSL